MPGTSGAAYAYAQPAAVATSAPRRKRRWLPALIAAIVAVALIGGGAAWAIPNFTTVRQVLHIGPQNPFAITAEAFGSLQDLSSTRFTLKARESSKYFSTDATVSGMIALGKTTDESTMDVNVHADNDDTLRFAWQHGGFAGQSGDSTIYASGDRLHSELRDALESNMDKKEARQYADLVFAVKDALVKDGKFDPTGTQKAMDDGMANIDDEYARDYRAARTDDPEATKQLTELVVNFVTKELEGKDVQQRVFPTVTSTKESDQTRLSYSIDLNELSHVAANYWNANQAKYPKAREAIIKSIQNNSDGMSASEAGKQLDDAIDDMASFTAGDDVSLNIEVAYALGYKLNEFSVTLTDPDDEDNHLDLSLRLSDQNKLSPDDASVTRFVQDAQDNNELK